MRIALFTETFYPRVDGITNTIARLLAYLDAQGHTSLMFAPHGAPARFHATRIHSFKGARLPQYPDFQLVSPFADYARHLRAFRPDIVHVVNPVALGLGGLYNGRRMGVPVVASYHTDVPGFLAQWGYRALSPLLARYFRAIHNQADLNLCPSSITKAALEKEGYRNVSVWSRGVDTLLFNPSKRDPASRDRLSGGHPEKPLLLCVSRLAREKRIDWIRDFLDAIPDVRLALVGEGPARGELERVFAGTPTTFAGRLEGEALAKAYASADIFVFPAANETFGNVALEAMASGLPVVAAGAGGPLDFVVHEETGLFFAPESRSQMTTAIRSLLAPSPSPETAFMMSDRARRMGMQGRAAALKRQWPTVMDGLIADYASVIARSAKPQHVLETSSAHRNIIATRARSQSVWHRRV